MSIVIKFTRLVAELAINGVKILRTQDTSDPRHFGTIGLVLKRPDSSAPVPKCLDSSAPVPKCLADTSALVPNCLDLQQTFCYNRPYIDLQHSL